MGILKTGDKAPGIKLPSTDKAMVDLHSYEGKKVLLLFFPMAFTGVCTKELCMMRDDIANYSNINAEVIAISVDSYFALAKFKELNNLPFTLLSDFNKDASNAYGCLYEEFGLGLKGVSKRSAFVIDQHGIICYEEILENPGELPNFEAINKVIETIK
ncbi:MAG: redoxin domain-containing protein [Saprospiraceae bacterium]|nr:redoxin domain-containing protein [Saprospiraceae bacterium]